MKKWKKILYISVSALCVVAMLFVAAFMLLVFGRIPLAYDRQALVAKAPITTVLDGTGAPIASPYLHSEGEAAPIPELVKQVFVAAEDQRFYEHAGVDLVRIGGSLLANIRSNSLSQGASTITQQVVKNRLLYVDKTYVRKFTEAIYAMQLEQDFTKDEILTMYLESSYYGKGAYGIEDAARAYFSKSPAELTITQAAALAATLKAPSNYAPHINEQANKRRRDMIIGNMLQMNMLTPAQAQAAKDAPLTIEPFQADHSTSWYVDAALEEAAALLKLQYDDIKTSGYQIHTAMDAALQREAAALFANPDSFARDAADGTLCQGALVVMDVESASVLALMGGREYTQERSFNRATDMKRQPGSVLKPIAVYAPAISRRYVTPVSAIWDGPVDFGGYKPSNYGGKYRGQVSLRTAAALSLNIPAVQLLHDLGPAVAVESMKRFGLEPDKTDTGLSLAVGSMTYGTSPLALCNAYCTLANQGKYRQPSFVTAIYDANGEALYLRKRSPGTQAIDAASAYVTTSILQSAASWGTAKTLNGLQIPIAAKTGTVDLNGSLNQDAWCAAYTPEAAAIAWLGFDYPNESHALPKYVTGGNLPTTMVRNILAKHPGSGSGFPQPEGVVWQNLAAPWDEPNYEVFIQGTEPYLAFTPTPQPTATPTPLPTQNPIWEPIVPSTTPDETPAETMATPTPAAEDPALQGLFPGETPARIPFWDWIFNKTGPSYPNTYLG